MKILTEHRPLLRAVTHAQGVVERRNTLPVLANVLIDARDGTLRIAATDTDIEIIETVPDAQITTPGAAMADARMFYEIVRKSPDGSQIEIEHDGKNDNLTIKIGRSRFQLRSINSEGFPAMSDDELPHRFVIGAEELRRLINKTRFIIPNEETRHYINGMYIHRKEIDGVEKMRAAVTDGHRLACISLTLPSGAEKIPGVIIPRKTINELQKLLEGAEEDVTCWFSENKCRFELEGVVMTSKLIDGTFPDYERVIPTDNDRSLSVNGKAFSEAVDRVSTITSEKSRAVKLALESNLLRVSASNLDGEDAQEDVVANYSSEEMEIGFNGNYLLEISNACDGEDSAFSLKDAGSPAIIRDSEDEELLYILMPMRI